MRLYNVSKDRLEGMYDGKVIVFEPGEKKDFYDKVEGSHILMKLEQYGMVEIPEKEISQEEISKFEIQGLQKRWTMLDMRLREWRTMNKEREAAKLSSMQPTQIIIDTCKELDEIEKRLDVIQKPDRDLVSKRLNEQSVRDTEKELKDRNVKLEGDSMTNRIVGKKKVRDAVPLAGG